MINTTKKLTTAISTFVVTITLGLASPAQAVLLTYDLQGILADGGSFEGTFSYDTDEPDLDPNEEESGFFLLKTWNIQVSSLSIGEFEWAGDVSTDDPDAVLFQFFDEGDEFVFFGFGINEGALELEEIADFFVGFEYLGSDLNSPAFPEEIGDFRRGVLFNNVEVTAAQIQQVSSIPESSSPLVLLVLGYLSTKSVLLRKRG